MWQTRTAHKNEDGCKKAIRWCEEVRVFPTFLSPFRTFTTTKSMFLGAAWFSNIRQSTFLQYWTQMQSLYYTWVPHQINYFNKSSNYHILTIWQFEFHSERSGSNATIDTSSWCVFISYNFPLWDISSSTSLLQRPRVQADAGFNLKPAPSDRPRHFPQDRHGGKAWRLFS